VHTGLGPGLLESVYDAVLAQELARRGLTVERQTTICFEYDGMRFDEGLRLDLAPAPSPGLVADQFRRNHT